MVNDPVTKRTPDTIQFFGKTLDGSSITMCETLSATGGSLKTRLETKIHIPTSQQRLTYNTEIQNYTTLQEISLQPNGTIHLSLYLGGGMNKDSGPQQAQQSLYSPNDTSNPLIHAHDLGILLTHSSEG
jgi:hypothetical protein